MHVSTITLHDAHNYGAALQAYALKEHLTEAGHTASIIDFVPASSGANNRKIKLSSSPRVCARSLVASLSWRKWKTRYNAFEKFKFQNMNLTERYSSLTELLQSPPHADAYICGSDQIWNPELPFKPQYFLDFGDPETRRISYAASFGVASAPDSKLSELTENLKRFNAISVRESSGVDIVKKAGYHADLVVDPTLLLDQEQWLKIATGPAPSEDYILTYCLEESPAFLETLERFARHVKLPVYSIATSIINRQKCATKVIKTAGPTEFLQLLANATYVFTNSFHGTAFALNLGRPLIGIPHTTRNGRMETLLEKLGWGNSQFSNKTSLQELIETAHERATDVNNDKIHLLQKSSIAFLKRELGAS
jgi:hypothetical protein